MRVKRPRSYLVALLISLLIILAVLSCGNTEDDSSASTPKHIGSSLELQQACGDLAQEIDEWVESEKLRLEEDFVTYSMTMLQVSERLEQIQRDAEVMSRKSLEECRAVAKEPLPTDRDPAETESRRGSPFPTPTPTGIQRTAEVVPKPTHAPTSTLIPTPTYTPTPTSTPALTPETVLGESPLIAAFAEVPASHNGRDSVQFQLLFTEPVSTSYKILRDIAIQVENGSVRQSKRVNKRNDLWMVTVEPEGNLDMVIQLTAPAGCDDAASVCTKGGKALANSPMVLVRYEQ